MPLKTFKQLSADYQTQREGYLRQMLATQLANMPEDKQADYLKSNAPKALAQIQATRGKQMAFADAALEALTSDGSCTDKAAAFTGALLLMSAKIEQAYSMTQPTKSDLYVAFQHAAGVTKDAQFTDAESLKALTAFEKHYRQTVLSGNPPEYSRNNPYGKAYDNFIGLHKTLLGMMQALKLSLVDAAETRFLAKEPKPSLLSRFGLVSSASGTAASDTPDQPSGEPAKGPQ